MTVARLEVACVGVLFVMMGLCAAAGTTRPVVQKGVVELSGHGQANNISVQRGSVSVTSSGKEEENRSRGVGLRDDLGLWQRPVLASPNGTFSLVDNPLDLSETCVEAIEFAPVWVRQDLQDAFRRLGDDADDYAELLLACPDSRFIDEIAFTIAHVAPRELHRLADAGDEDLLLVNAERIYSNAEHLHYVRLVEHDEGGGDFYTTVAYYVQDGGQRAEKELPMDYYYWYIVHPKVNAEYLKMDNLPSEQQATYGYFWREFLFSDPSEDKSYEEHYFQKEPNRIPDSDLVALAGYATGHLTSRSWDLLPIIYDENGGVVLSEIRYNSSEVIVTSIRLEQAYEDGASRLLENVVLYGDTAELMPAGSKVMIIKDRGSTAIEDILTEHGYSIRVVGSSRVGVLSLSGYFKVIVPSDQPKELYEALAANKAWITDWFKSAAPRGRVFEFHGACQPEDSWTSLAMLASLRCADLNEATIGPLAFGGYPRLEDVMSEPTVLWDRRDGSKGGELPFKDDENALIRLGKWVNKVIPALAKYANHRGVQPNQIAYEHNGNCGENQDLLCAAARACLIPVSCVDLLAEDHVWNEVYDEGWHFYETWRGGIMTTVGGKGTGVLDMDYGGHYPFSGVFRWRNDGLIEDITDRYSKTCELDARVVDSNGLPVDGALVEVWASNVLAGPYPDYMRSVWGYTDATGTVKMKLGNTRNLYARCETPLGNYPAGEDKIDEFAPYSRAGAVYSWDVSVPGTMPSLSTFAVPPPETDDGTHLSISFALPYQTLYCRNPMDYNVAAEKLRPGQIDFVICDAEDFQKLGRGETFGAFAQMWDATQGSLDFPVSTSSDYYLVFSNIDRLSLNQALYYSLDVVGGDGHIEDSISNLVRVPPGTYHAVRWSYHPAANRRPVIVEAGFLDTTVSESEGGLFKVIAYVVDPDGPNDVRSVQLFYNGQPTGLFLADDGTGGDSVANDSLFTLEMNIGPGMPAGQHRVSLVAVDADGLRSVEWPYVEVSAGRGAQRGILEDSSFDNERLVSIERTIREALLDSRSNSRSQGGRAPVIMAGGFGFTDISSSDGGELRVYAHVEGFGEKIEKVEAFLEGGVPLGMFLHDDGVGGDAVAGDGQFTFQCALGGGLAPGRYLVELVGTTSAGVHSQVFPYVTVTP